MRQVHCGECSWSSKPTSTDAIALRALRVHSCDKQRAAAAAHARHLARMSAVDRTPKPCLHKIARHTHGTHSCYVLDRCRCAACAGASVVYYAALARRNAYGRSGLVDAQGAREHVHALTTAGMGLKRIALHDGVSHGALWKLMYGKTKPDGTRTLSKRVTVATERAILAIPMPTVADLGATVVVDSTGTRRRLEALIALGWSVQRLADDNDLGRPALDNALARKPVCAKTAVTVKAMFETIGDRRAPETTYRERISAARSRNRARSKGWEPPAARDDDTIDDPTAPPASSVSCAPDEEPVDEVTIARAATGRRVALTRVERATAITRMTAQGLSDRQIADRLHLSSQTVLRVRTAARIVSRWVA